MKHSFSVSELQTVCSVHVANDPSQVVSVYYVRDSGVVSVEELDSQLYIILVQNFLKFIKDHVDVENSFNSK